MTNLKHVTCFYTPEGPCFLNSLTLLPLLLVLFLAIMQLFYYDISLYLYPFQKKNKSLVILYTDPLNCFKYWMPHYN